MVERPLTWPAGRLDREFAATLGDRLGDGVAPEPGPVVAFDQPGDAAGLADLAGPAQRIVQHLVGRGQQAVLGGQKLLFGGADVAHRPPKPVGHANPMFLRPTADRKPPYLFWPAVDTHLPVRRPGARFQIAGGSHRTS